MLPSYESQTAKYNQLLKDAKEKLSVSSGLIDTLNAQAGRSAEIMATHIDASTDAEDESAGQEAALRDKVHSLLSSCLRTVAEDAIDVDSSENEGGPRKRARSKDPDAPAETIKIDS